MWVNRSYIFWSLLLAGWLSQPGCLIVQTQVTNPIPQMSTIAIIPFFNLSQEPTVDGRRFALAYYSELQKTPGFQVLPLGVAEQVIREQELQMNDPLDVIRLAEYLDVDAVVVGAITDYDPYYPPRIGLQISWYSPYQWEFCPGIQTEPQERKSYLKADREQKKQHGDNASPGQTTIIGDSPATTIRGQSESQATPTQPPFTTGETVPPDAIAVNPIQPVMSYSRIFDGADANIVAVLRDYVELSGDRRSGGWEAYLHRSEDFIRFACHRMIVEMLTLHGGEAQRRYVWKIRNDR